MSELDGIRSVLIEIRDDQKSLLEEQREHVALAREQLERARRQVEESLALQREAVAKQKFVTRAALPAIAFCIVAILYLIFRYL